MENKAKNQFLPENEEQLRRIFPQVLHGDTNLIHSLLHHFETIPDSKKLQTTVVYIWGF